VGIEAGLLGTLREPKTVPIGIARRARAALAVIENAEFHSLAPGRLHSRGRSMDDFAQPIRLFATKLSTIFAMPPARLQPSSGQILDLVRRDINIAAE